MVSDILELTVYNFRVIFLHVPSVQENYLTKPQSRKANLKTEIVSFFRMSVTIYRVSQEERAKLREGVPYVKLYQYNPKHLYPKLNGFRDNGK